MSNHRLQTLLDRMPRQYAREENSNNYKLLKIIAENGVENLEVQQTILKFWDVDKSQGVGLDRLGKDEGISRGGWDDDEYRKMIKIQCIVNLSEGDLDTMNLILDAYMGNDFIGIYEMWNDKRRPEPAAFKAKRNFDTDNVPKGLLKRIKAAGVRAYWAAYILEQIKYTFINLVYTRIHIDTSSNPWAQAGNGGYGSEAILLNGKYNLNGERFLNSFYNTSGPDYLTNIRLVMKVLHDFGIHEVNVTPILDGEFRLNGEILLQNYLQTVRLAVLQDAVINYKKRETLHVVAKYQVPMLCGVTSMSGVHTLNGANQLNGNINFNQTLFDHSGLFRVKKSGVTVEEMAM